MNLAKLLSRNFPVVEQTVSDRDAIIYALGIGAGQNSTGAAALRYCYEEDLKLFPTLVNVIAHPSGWLKDPDLGIDYAQVVHGEQSFDIRQPLPREATYLGHTRIIDVIDKGIDKGAILCVEKELRNKTTGGLISMVRSTYFLRGDGGSGGTGTRAPTAPVLPTREPDGKVVMPIPQDAALLYRLSGDDNPLHASPREAQRAGFPKPILHGLCTMGIAARALIENCCNDEPEHLQSMNVRFSSPVYPGESLETILWSLPEGHVRFVARVVERGATVLTNGSARIAC